VQYLPALTQRACGVFWLRSLNRHPSFPSPRSPVPSSLEPASED
jgi:hypothetical protein